MITRIELTNFMSHERTVIEPAAGLTVLVGPNNCGKSALVAALQILCRNDSSTYVTRHGAKECSVRVETDDGHAVEWRRKNAPSYEIDGQKFDRLGVGGVPELLHKALRLPLVETGEKTSVDVHFGEQKSPILSLLESESEAARFFASSSDVSHLVEMQKRHKARHTERQRKKNALEAESRQLTAELEALAPAVDLDRAVKEAEEIFHTLQDLAQQLSTALEVEHRWTSLASAATQLEARAQALLPLESPPALKPIESLEKLVEGLTSAQRGSAHEQDRCEALGKLDSPPLLHDAAGLAGLLGKLIALAHVQAAVGESCQLLAGLAAPFVPQDEHHLATLIRSLTAGGNRVKEWQQASAIVSAAAAPEIPLDTSELQGWLARWEVAEKVVSAGQIEVDSAAAELQTAADQLRTAAQESECPLCGSPLDAERLLSRAAAGTGGHAHA